MSTGDDLARSENDPLLPKISCHTAAPKHVVFTATALDDSFLDDDGNEGVVDDDEYEGERSRLIAGEGDQDPASSSSSYSPSGRRHKRRRPRRQALGRSSVVVQYSGGKAKAASINAMISREDESSSTVGSPASDGTVKMSRPLFSLSELRTSTRASGDFSHGLNSGFFDLLPDELVVKVLLFTNIKTIAKISETCSRMNSLAWDPGLWNAIAKTKSWDAKRDKAYYISQYQKRKEKKEADRRAAIAERERQRKEVKKNRARNAVICLSSRIWEWFYALLFVLFLVASTLKLEYVVDWPWIVIVSPLLAILVHMYFFVGIFVFLQNKYDMADITPEANECYKPLCNSLWFRGYEADKGGRCACFSPLLLILPFLILIVLYMIIGEAYIPLWTLPIPLHLITFYLWAVPKAGGVECGCEGHQQLVWQTTLLAGAALTTFLALMSVKLAWPTSLYWVYVVLPLVILEVWTVILPLVLFIGQCCCVELDDDDLGFTIAYFIVTLVLAAPVLAFELMVALTFDAFRDYRWSVLMVPWYIITTLVMASTAILSFAICCDA
ncbi:hypothetical protein Pelo_10794 [Pelomyxa schiedti]|nr:hypothetical protein Pelo_10794 [Pelomyxa schiedti]